MFQSDRSLPAPARSEPYQISLRLLLSSKKALTCRGKPVVTGSGRKQNALPSTAAELPAIQPAPTPCLCVQKVSVASSDENKSQINKCAAPPVELKGVPR